MGCQGAQGENLPRSGLQTKANQRICPSGYQVLGQGADRLIYIPPALKPARLPGNFTRDVRQGTHKTMKNDPTGKPNRLISRRTGLDRRWIPSADHHPERRHGQDRRTIRKRSFLQPLAVNDPEERPPAFPLIVSGTPETEV